MLALQALLLLVCAVQQFDALPYPAPTPALVQYHAQDELGQYAYGYSGGPSAKHEERTLDGATRGSYSYIDGNGLVQTRAYEADDYNGFRVIGTDIAAPSGVARSPPIITSKTVVPVSTYRSPPFKTYKTYQPVYIDRGYNTIESISGNEISYAPVTTPTRTSVPITPYASPLEYVKSTTYRTPVYYPTRYVRNNIEVSPESSVGIRYPTYTRVQPIAYSDSLAAAQSTATPVYSNGLPIPVGTVSTPIERVTITPTAIPYVEKSVQSPVVVNQPSGVYERVRLVGVTNTRPAPIAYTDAAPGPITITTHEVPATPVTYSTHEVPVTYTTHQVPATPVTYTTHEVPVTYTTHEVPAPVTYTTGGVFPVYGYYPASEPYNIIRYASAAPSIQASVYEPVGGYKIAKPVPLQEAYATQYHAQDELGQYRYGYSNINSAKEESKTIDGVTRGSFSYVDANGLLQSRSYVSDDINGFRVIGTDIPKDPNGQVNPDAIPGDHVNVATIDTTVPVLATGAPAHLVSHESVALSSQVPAHVVSHGSVGINAPFIVSSTPATLLK